MPVREREEIQAVLREVAVGKSAIKRWKSHLPPDRSGSKLWQMKLRLDLLEQLTAEDILEEVLANNHRYKPEPLFSTTGLGSLSPATEEDRAREIQHCIELTQKLEQRARTKSVMGP